MTFYKYNLELRHIDNLFNFDYPFFNEDLKPQFEKLFIKRYAFRQIGFPTIGEFKFRLQSYLEENNDYFKQLWEIELRTKAIDFMNNKEYTETLTRDITEKEKEEIINKSLQEFMSTEIIQNSGVNTTTTDTLNSNVNDGMANLGFESGLTDNTKETVSENLGSSNSTNGSNSTNTNSSDNSNRDKLFTENVVTHGVGNIGVTSAADLKKGWIDVTYSLISKVIDGGYDLFLQRY